MYHKVLLAVVAALGICTLGESEETEPSCCGEKQTQVESKKGRSFTPCTCVRFELFDYDSFVMYYAEAHAANSQCNSPMATYYNGEPGIIEQTCSTTTATCIGDKKWRSDKLTDKDVFTGFSPALFPGWTFEPASDRVTVVRKPDAERFVQFNVSYKNDSGVATTISPIVKLFTVVVDPTDTLKSPPEVVLPTLHYLAVQVSKLPDDYPAARVPQVTIAVNEDGVLPGGKALSLKSENPWKAPILLLLSAR